MTITNIAAASLLAVISATTVFASIQGGYQSGPSPGSFYSGGMTYINRENRAFLTGSHYNQGLLPHDGSNSVLMQGTIVDTASSCYLAKVDFDEVASGDTFHTLSDWDSFGNIGKIETCSAVASTAGSDVYVVGSTAQDGLFSDGYPMQGLLSILNRDNLSFIDATLIKSAEDPSKHMIYPLDVIHDFGRKYIYIAALTSTDATKNPIIGNKGQPNWQEQHMLGSAFDVTVIKIHAPVGEKPDALWVKHFPLDAETDGTRPPVFVAGMAIQRDTNGVQHLLLSGSTRGGGEAFGKAAPGSTDEDGFVMQLALHDGSFIQHDRHVGKIYEYKEDLREGTPSDDFIRGMCNNRERGSVGEVEKSDRFYIVGGTKGDMTTDDQGVQNNGVNAGFQFGAGVETKYKGSWNRDESLMPFLRQVSITDLKPIWTTQWASMPKNNNNKNAMPTNAFAMDCFVDNKIGAIYVVGSVLGDAKMTQGDVEMLNQGGDDIWVAKVDEETGNVFWLTQLGSMDDEKLARHGSIAVNKEGNVLIYGDTNGSLYRPRASDEDPAVTDMFLMTIDGNTGAVVDNYYMGGTSSASVAATINGVSPVANLPEAESLPADADDNAPADDVSPYADKVQANPDDDNYIIDGDGNAVKKINKQPTMQQKMIGTVGIAVAILFAILAILAGLFVFYSRQMIRRKAEAQKSSIFACLQQFDVEDIDLRRSPPGGWHGTYMNKLAYGHNNADDDSAIVETTPESAPLSHSSVANDALFMDGNPSNFQIDDEDDVDIRLNSNDGVV